MWQNSISGKNGSKNGPKNIYFLDLIFYFFLNKILKNRIIEISEKITGLQRLHHAQEIRWGIQLTHILNLHACKYIQKLRDDFWYGMLYYMLF